MTLLTTKDLNTLLDIPFNEPETFQKAVRHLIDSKQFKYGTDDQKLDLLLQRLTNQDYFRPVSQVSLGVDVINKMKDELEDLDDDYVNNLISIDELIGQKIFASALSNWSYFCSTYKTQNWIKDHFEELGNVSRIDNTYNNPFVEPELYMVYILVKVADRIIAHFEYDPASEKSPKDQFLDFLDYLVDSENQFDTRDHLTNIIFS